MHAWLASLGRHKTLKFLSLFLAIALWAAVGGEERTETNLNIPLELLNLTPNLMITSDVPSGLQVRVIGPRSLIRTLSQSRLSHTLDLTGLKPGRHNFPLGLNSFAFPRGIQVARVQPNPLTLTLTPTVTRTLPVQLVFIGHPPQGYEVKGTKTRPAQVTVKGPLSELEALKFLPTVPLDLTSLTGPTTLSADLDFKNLHLSPVEPFPLLADLDIGPKTGRRTFPGIPVTPQPQPARLSPPQVTVTLQGPSPQLKDLKPNDIKATIDNRGLPRGRHSLKVNLQLPPGFTLDKVTPDTLSVRVGK